MNKSELFWQTYLNLEDELLKVAKYVYFTDVRRNGQPCHHLDVYSPLIADLLLRCCTEIEAISKELFHANGGTFSGDVSEFYYDTVCLDYLNNIFRFGKKVVYVVSPLFEFDDELNKKITPLHNAHKRQGTYWSKAYQCIKHDKYSSIHKGNIKALIKAMAALFLLNIYLKNISFKLRHNEFSKQDMSFGSRIFATAKPTEVYIMNVLNNENVPDPLESEESPYIFKYTQETYKLIKESNIQSRDQIQKIINSQPEMKDPLFVVNLYNYLKNEKNPNAFTIMGYIYKYRINKEIPPTLPFEQRKEMLLKSHWWASSLFKDNITEENIQEQIDMIASFAGQREIINIEYPRIQKGLNDAGCEMVIDNGNIRY